MSPHREKILDNCTNSQRYAVLFRAFLLGNYVVGGLQISAASYILFGFETARRVLLACVAVGSTVGLIDVIRWVRMRVRL